MEEDTAANPADEVVNLDADQGTGLSDSGANTPAEGGSDDLDALTKEALGDAPANLEFVEVEVDGRKLKVMTADGEPIDPDIKFGVMRDGDYRKKTMAHSDEVKAFETERQAFQARANLTGQAALRSQELHALDAQVRNLGSIDLGELYSAGWSDEQVEQAKAEFMALAAKRDNLAGMVQRDVAASQQQVAAELTRIRDDARKQAGLQDKAITPDRIEKLERFAVENGFSEQAVGMIDSPAEYRMLHYAEIGKQFIERQRNAANMRAAAAGSPAATLSGVKAGQKSPEAMSMEEYAAWRAGGNS